MSNATVSSSGKTQSGTLHSVGGNGFDDYFANLVGVFDGDLDDAMSVVKEVRAVLRPVGSGYAYGSTVVAPASNEPRGDAGVPPGQTLCPSHKQPAKYIKGKTGGEFWKCPVNDTFINNYQSSGFKSECPQPKQ